MKKSVYLTILTIITVICIIAGTCYHFVGWGVSLFDHIFPGFTTRQFDTAGPVITDEMVITEEFDTINVDVYAMSLEIVPGDTAMISYESNTKISPKFEVKNHTLNLTQNNIHRSNSSWNLTGNNKCDVVLTVPKDVFYKKIAIDSNLGDIDIAEISGKSLVIDANTADVDISTCEFEHMDIDTDLGDVDVTDSMFQILSVDNSLGDTSVDGVSHLSDYTIDMDTSLGTVYVNGTSHHDAFAQSGTGNQKITLYNSLGDISLSGK